MIKEVKETFDPICEKAFAAHKEATGKRAKFLDPLTAAQKSVKQIMGSYDAEQERIRKAEEDRLRKIEEERLAEERQIEQKRLADEAKAEEDRLLNEAQAAEQRGDTETAELLTNAAVESTEQINEVIAAVAAEPIYVAPVVVPKAIAKIQGGPIYRTVTKFQIINADLIPRQYMVPDMVKIGGVVRALKTCANIPGIKVYEERV